MADTLDEILIRIRSGEVSAQVDALERVKEVLQELSSEAAHALVKSSGRYAVAEKLLALGSIMVPALEALLQTESDSEALTYAALVLLRLGSNAGVERLLISIRDGVGPTGMIVENLSRAGVKQAADVIAQALLSWDLERDPYTAATLVVAMRRLHAEVPADVLEHLMMAFPNVKEFSANSDMRM